MRLITLFFLILFVSCASSSKQLISAREAKKAGNLQEAYQLYKLEFEKSGNSEARRQVQEIGKLLAVDERQQIVEDFNSDRSNTVPSLTDLRQRIDAANEMDPDNIAKLEKLNIQIDERLAHLQNKSIALLEDLKSSLAIGSVPSSIETFKKLKKINPDLPGLQTVEKEFVDLYSGYLNTRVMGRLQSDQPSDIQAELQKVAELGLSDSSVQLLTSLLGEKALAQTGLNIRDKISRRQYYSAYLDITSAGFEDKFAAELGQIRTQGGSFYLSQARQRMKRGETSRAFLEAAKGYELAPGLSGMLEVYRDAQDKVASQLERFIAISAFGAPQKNPDLGPQFSDALISHLFRILPFDIKILEREKIDLALKEQGREFAKVGNLLNVDLIITGNVSLMEIDQQESKSAAVTRVKIGENIQPNPEYSKRRNSDNPPPETIGIPVYENVQYEKGRVTLKGFATVSARIFDAQMGSIAYAQEFNARYEVSDDFQQAVTGSTLEEDFLELPSQTEVHEILRNKIIEQLSEVIQKQFAKRKDQFVQEAKYFLSRSEKGKVIETLAKGFLYNIKAKTKSDDPDLVILRNMIVENTESDFI